MLVYHILQAQLRSKKRQAVQNGALCGMCEHVLTRAVGDREPMALAQFQEYAMAVCVHTHTHTHIHTQTHTHTHTVASPCLCPSQKKRR